MKTDLLQRIREEMPSFSKGQKMIGSYILEHYDKAAYLTAARMGAAVGVSESTVVRFAIELGYSGYPEFQHSLREMIRSRLTTVQRIDVTNNLIGDGNVLDKILAADADRIRRTMEEVDHASFEEAINKIVSAKNIYILGVRSSATLAGFLNYNFRMIFDNVKLVKTTSSSDMFEQIMQVKEGDVMIAISFPRYSKRIINAVEYARSKNANVVALTDSPQSPIAAFSNQLLVAQSDMVSFVDSLAAPLSIVNAMIAAVSRAKQEDLTQRLHALEEVWGRYGVYASWND